ncbi:pyridoxamine 5'-phosphate oxidase [Streptomyces albulus]|nr:pyridoxamine 5'-phosphate oxidase [Streptomyces noursei]
MEETSGTQDAGGPAEGAARAGCPDGIRRALAEHTTVTLAYADEDGPQACAVLTPPARPRRGAGAVLRHRGAHPARPGPGPARRPGGVHGAAGRPGVERTERVQGRGGCRPLSGAEQDAGWRAYTARFPSSPPTTGCARPWNGPRCGSCARTGCG